MKQGILLIITILFVGFTSCRVGIAHPYATTYRTPEYRVRHHWGAPRRTSIHGRYWGRHRYGPRPYAERGRHHY